MNVKTKLKVKLHLFDLLWICCTTSCTTNPQQIHNKSGVYNKSTTSRHVEMLYNKAPQRVVGIEIEFDALALKYGIWWQQF